jgi:uncharacterized protein YdeI (YjbR/CyaY-like superfamily)
MKAGAAAAPRFFATARAWGEWIARHHLAETELLVGFHKGASGRPCMSWSESVDEALCGGWIDGVRKPIDAQSYTIRFSRRKPGSIWSKVNIAKAEALIAAGRMHPAGLAAYQRRTAARSGIYSFEQGPLALDPASLREFQTHRAAWDFFLAQAPSYRKKIIWRILSARQPATRARRLAAAIACSQKGERLP